MERDVAISHGMGVFMKERMMECSDLYTCSVCDLCGMIVSKLKNTSSYYCNGCDNHSHISTVQIPYACKLMIQELMAINIWPKLGTQNTITKD
jgi:DNA-directed RNA polymerase II subunit RPB2